MARTVLFLQGPPSTFWRELSEHFDRAGATTHRINLSMGDWVYWRKRGATNYRGRFSGWADFLREYIVSNGVTDILYYADRLPYHAVAREIAQAMGVRTYAVEFGYLRPDWLTLERGGMGALSHFPEDPEVIRDIAARVGALAPQKDRYSHGFGQEAFNEVFYNLLTSLVPYLFPLYRSDKYYLPLIDYLAWLPRTLSKRIREPSRVWAVAQLRSRRKRYWMLALQMQSDYQLRANAHYRHQGDVIDEVMKSFAACAPDDSHLVVKLHPLDNGLERWERVVARAAKRHGVTGRALAVSDCDLKRTMRRSSGVITINSTVGLHALRAGVPVAVLGSAVYDIAGLTHQDALDTFWTHPQQVDPQLRDALVDALAATIQVHGSFYHPRGREAACIEIVDRILNDRVNHCGAFVDPPPRMSRALRNKVPIHRSLQGSGIEPASWAGDEAACEQVGRCGPDGGGG